MKKKKVYIALSADILNPAHLNIIDKGLKLGDVIIGLLTDSAISSYKNLPALDYEARYKIISSVKNIKKIIKQDTLDYQKNLIKIKPDYVLHGDDWKTGLQSWVREKVIRTLKKWNGKLIEVPYSEKYNSTKLKREIKNLSSTPDLRIKSLRRLLSAKKTLKFLDIHNGLSALIVEKTKMIKNKKLLEFDGMWASSLTSSTAKGKPDIEAVDSHERIQVLNEVLEVTTKPIIYDGDTGGKVEHFIFLVKTLERLGISAVIIEDKKGLKKNSLFGNDVFQQQESVKNFSKKITEGKKCQLNENFMIIARIESLILDKSVKEAMFRAKSYLRAGADGIMIHSKEKNTSKIFQFFREYNKLKNRKVLVVAPSSYYHIKDEELKKRGVNIILYANHLLRSVYPSMLNTAKSILKHGRTLETEKKLLSIKNILNLIPGTK